MCLDNVREFPPWKSCLFQFHAEFRIVFAAIIGQVIVADNAYMVSV